MVQDEGQQLLPWALAPGVPQMPESTLRKLAEEELLVGGVLFAQSL